MKHVLFAIFFLSASTLTQANGWVKSPGQYYMKLSYAQTSEDKRSGSGLFSDLLEQEIVSGFYGEWGLPGPLTWQAVLDLGWKNLSRTGSELGDSLENDALRDTRVALKTSLFNTTLAGVSLLGALQLGAILPTTPKEHRLGAEADLNKDLPVERLHLAQGIDRGSFGLTGELGVSAFYKFMWLNASLTRAQPVKDEQDNNWKEEDIATAIGIALPWNSWLQGQANFLTKTFGVSAGLTFWRGYALELGWQKEDAFARRITVGFSARTL